MPRVRVSGPADILAVVPHLMGFHPRLSFVVIGAAGARRRVELGFRYDLPDPPGAEAAADIAGHAIAVLAQRGARTVIGIGYGPGRLVTPVADAFAAAARQRRLELRELLRVEDGRYWSYLCANVACCPADGTAFDYASHPAAAAMTVAGLAAYPDRDAVAATIAPVTGDAARAMDRAIDRACLRSQALVGRAQRCGPGNPLRLAISEGRRAVREAIAGYRGGGRITDEDRLAWLAVSLVHLAVRDDAWARMVPEHGRHTCRYGPTSCAVPTDRGCPRPPRCSPSPRGRPATERSRTLPWSGRSPPIRATPWRCCCGTSSLRACRPRRRACR